LSLWPTLISADADVLCMVQVVSFDNLEDQELEKREVSEGLFLLSACSKFTQ